MFASNGMVLVETQPEAAGLYQCAAYNHVGMRVKMQEYVKDAAHEDARRARGEIFVKAIVSALTQSCRRLN